MAVELLDGITWMFSLNSSLEDHNAATANKVTVGLYKLHGTIFVTRGSNKRLII